MIIEFFSNDCLAMFSRLKEHWNKLGYPDLSVAIQAARDLLEKTEDRLMEAYLEEKVEPLIGIVEPSMYAGRFDWNKSLPIGDDIRPYCKEIIMNMIAVHAEVAQVFNSLVVIFKFIRLNSLFCISG